MEWKKGRIGLDWKGYCKKDANDISLGRQDRIFHLAIRSFHSGSTWKLLNDTEKGRFDVLFECYVEQQRS